MPAKKYRVYQWGPRVLTAAGQPAGATGAARVAIAGVAKKATAADPYIVVNEVVCNALARSLVLPCPPGATLDNAGETYFFSLDFSLAGQALPPVDPVAVVAAFPRLSWGIILFDSLVMLTIRARAAYKSSTTVTRFCRLARVTFRLCWQPLTVSSASAGIVWRRR